MEASTDKLIAPPVSHSDIRRFAEDRVNLPADIARERRQKVNDLRERLGKWMNVASAGLLLLTVATKISQSFVFSTNQRRSSSNWSRSFAATVLAITKQATIVTALTRSPDFSPR